MERVSSRLSVAASLPPPPTAFYEHDNPRNWTVSIISRGLMLEESGCREIRSTLKQEMENRHLIGSSLSAPHNQEKLSEALKQLELAFPLVFTSDIPRQWLESCELGMARKINYTHTACNRKQRNVRVPTENTDSSTRPRTFDQASFYVQAKRTRAYTLLSPFDIVKPQKALPHLDIDDIDFGMFKEVLREDKVHDPIRDRIMCRIGNKDIEIDHSRKFKAAVRIMYEGGQAPMSFLVEERPLGRSRRTKQRTAKSK